MPLQTTASELENATEGQDNALPTGEEEDIPVLEDVNETGSATNVNENHPMPFNICATRVAPLRCSEDEINVSLRKFVTRTGKLWPV